MFGRNDIVFADDPDSGKSTEELVWMVQGDEKPFTDAQGSSRPWLEESVEWSSPTRPDFTPGRGEADSDGLLWL